MTNPKSTTRFPTSYRWSMYVTPKSRKGGSKSDSFVFWNKSQLQSNKVCYRVYVKASRGKLYSTVIPLSNAPFILAQEVTL